MKIAVTGKGGAGKTTIAGTLARLFADRSHQVVAVDADVNPNLGVTLGLDRAAVMAMQPILNALLASGYTHDDPKIPAEELLARYGIPAPGGVTLVATGKVERPTDACLCCGSHSTTRAFFGELPARDRTVVADLEAGLNDFVWTRPGTDDVVVAIADPSAKAVEIARRACALAREMGVHRILGIANRSAREADADRLAEALGEDVMAVPDDPAIERSAERAVAPLDADPSSPAVLAVSELADRLEAVATAG